IVADVVQQAIDQRLTYLAARDANRSGHGEAALVARHAWDQILAVVYCFGQTLKLCTVAEKIRTHGEHDIDRQLTLLCGFEQEFYKSGCLISAGALVCRAETKQLFKLIDNEK